MPSAQNILQQYMGASADHTLVTFLGPPPLPWLHPFVNLQKIAAKTDKTVPYMLHKINRLASTSKNW